MVAIGALSPNDVLTGFSSRGPVPDGRIIPQLVIEGAEGTSNGRANPRFDALLKGIVTEEEVPAAKARAREVTKAH
jgi:hypothetical protein